MPELSDLEAVEVSLVPRAANKKKFLLLKSEGGNEMDEILKALIEAELDDEQNVDKVLKAGKVSDKAANAVKGALKLLNAFKDELPKDIMNTLASLGGYGYAAPTQMAKQTCGTGGAGGYKPMKKEDGSLDLEGVPEDMKPTITALWKDREDMVKKSEILEAMIKKQEDDKLTEKYVQVAKSFKGLVIKPEEFGIVLKEIAINSPKSIDKIEEVLKSADQAIVEGGIFKEIGSSAGGSGGAKAMDKIEQKAVEIMKSEKISKAEAITKALEIDPSLYSEYLKEGGN